MKIVVEDIAVKKNSGGVYSVLIDFYNQVKKLNTDDTWIFLLSDQSLIKETENIKVKIFSRNWIKRFLFSFVYGRRVINKEDPDVYVSLQNITTQGVKTQNKWTYLHQPIPFQREKNFSLFKKQERVLAIHQHVIGKLIKFSLKHSSTDVIVQTEWMRQELKKRNIKQDDKIKVLPPVDLLPNELMINDAISLKKQFFFPANAFVYKNHETIIKAVNLLVDQGITDFKVIFTISTTELRELVKGEIPEQVKCCGYMERSKVIDTYSSSVLIFPSYIESFGLPLLEAKTVGTIIFASDTSFSKEILDGYNNAYFFKYNDYLKLSQLMADYLNGKVVINSLNSTKSTLNGKSSEDKDKIVDIVRRK